MSAVCTCYHPKIAYSEHGAPFCKVCSNWWQPEHGSRQPKQVEQKYYSIEAKIKAWKRSI